MNFRATIRLTSLLTVFSLVSAQAGKQQINGQKIFFKACAMCHVAGIAGAPKAHNQADWKNELNQVTLLIKNQKPTLDGKSLEKAAMQYLVNTVKTGLGAMPKGGMCKNAHGNICSDSEYLASIKYMMSPKKDAQQ